jgi:hypothetical protein
MVDGKGTISLSGQGTANADPQTSGRVSRQVKAWLQEAWRHVLVIS